LNVNSDLGEGAGADAAILSHIDSANVGCGVHAGSASITIATAFLCRRLGIEIGAHPGYDDRDGFGRRELGLSAQDIEALPIALKRLENEGALLLPELEVHLGKIE